MTDSPTTIHHMPPTDAPPQLTRDEIRSRLGAHGYRVTAPRSAIVDAVLGHKRPFSAEQLVADIQETAGGSAIGRATVYRTLEVLAAIDVLSRIVGRDGRPAYMWGAPGHRHHLLCTTCGRTITFTACPVDGLLDSLRADTGFSVDEHVLEVFGQCPECQAQS